MKKITEFLLFSSGADLHILNQCPSDRSKYAGIGGTVLFTGILAAVAAGYALFTVFDNYVTAIMLGLIWGVMIFNLDRFIVSSMRKEERFIREIIPALPRILLAIIISLVIAKPVELRIFAKEIEPELVLMEQQVYLSQETEVKARFEPVIAQLRNNIQSFQKEVADKTTQRDQLAFIAQQEADGTGGSKVKNLGPIYKVKKADAERVEAELEALSKTNSGKISVLQERLSQVEDDMNKAVSGLTHTKINGPAARMEALSRLTDKSTAIWWGHIFIIMLFLMIELSPILVKLLSKKGPYDTILHSIEHGFICREIESIAEATTEAKKRAAAFGSTEQGYVGRKLDAELL